MYKRLFYGLIALNLLGLFGLGFTFKNHLYSYADLHMHKYKKTATGLQYRFVKNGNGVIPKAGDKLLITLVCKTAQGIIVLDTSKEKQPTVINFPTEDTQSVFPPLPTEAIQMMREGDQVMCKLTALELLGDNFSFVGQMKQLKENTLLFTQFTLNSVMDPESYEKWAAEMKDKMMKDRQEKLVQMQKKQEVQLERDMELMEKYIDQNKLKDKHTIKETSSGLRYIIHNVGRGLSPTQGDEVTLNYTGKNLEDKVFDTSLEKIGKDNDIKRGKFEPLKVTLGSLIPGFNEAVSIMKKGSKMTVFIPSTLAYGISGNGKHIPPNTVLIFDIELLSFTKQKPEAEKHNHNHNHNHNHKH